MTRCMMGKQGWRKFAPRVTGIFAFALLALSGAWVGRGVHAQESVGGQAGAAAASTAQWRPLGARSATNRLAPIGALAADESDAAGPTLLVAAGDDIWKTTDAGQSWGTLVQHPLAGLTPGRDVMKSPIPEVASVGSISVSPGIATHHLVLATSAAFDEPEASLWRLSVWRSTNGGVSFERVSLGEAATREQVFAVAFDPRDATGLRAYAFVNYGGAKLSVGQRPQAVGAVFVTTDGGETWSSAGSIRAVAREPYWPALATLGSAGADGFSRICVALIAAGESSETSPMLLNGEAALRSSTWKMPQLSSGMAGTAGGALSDRALSGLRAIVGDAGVAGTFYAASREGVLVSADEGQTWQALDAGGALPGAAVTSLAIHEASRTLYAGTEDGKVWALGLPAATDESGDSPLDSSSEPAADKPKPKLTSITPNNAQVGSPGLTVTIAGTGFISMSVINFGSTTLAPSTITSTSLTATVPNSAYAQASEIAVTVTNPGPGGGTSNGVHFDVSDFAFGKITPQTQTVIAGATATYMVPVIALHGYNTDVTMTCEAGIPPAANCYFSPTTVVPTQTEAVTIVTASNTGSGAGPSGGRRLPPAGPVRVRIYLLAAGFFVVGGHFLIGWRRREEWSVSWRREGVVVALFLMGAFVMTAGGCGGSASSTESGVGTTPGTYTITLSATGTNGTTHDVNVVLVVTEPQ